VSEQNSFSTTDIKKPFAKQPKVQWSKSRDVLMVKVTSWSTVLPKQGYWHQSHTDGTVVPEI